MTVVFGFPSAEHVTITPGVPFSSTGRISGGRRVIGFSSVHRWEEARSGAWSRRLQVDFEHLEVDRQRGRRDERVQHGFRGVGIHRPEALHKSPADAIRDLDVTVLDSAMVEVAALELIRLV